MVTIKDVALRAGVTPATVSNVVRGKNVVAVETKARVQAAISELNYRPNLMARGLVRGETSSIALVLPDITNPFYPEIALELELLANEAGYQVLVCNTYYSRKRVSMYLEKLAGGLVDGVVVLDGAIGIEDLQNLCSFGVPIVACMFGYHLDTALPLRMSRVEVDFREAGRLAARHLLAKGHRDIALLVAARAGELGGHTERFEGFLEILAEHDIRPPNKYLRFTEPTIDAGRRSFLDLQGAGGRPTAIFAGNDLSAIGAMGAAIDSGLSIPDDLSIVGVDDIMLSAHIRPALTTASVSMAAIAGHAFRLFRQLVSDINSNETVVLSPTLAERSSVKIPKSTLDTFKSVI